MVSAGIRIAGFGGQGVILAGIVIGKAAAIHDGRFATLTQSFGPEARGSSCSAQLIVSDEPNLYPYLTAGRYPGGDVAGGPGALWVRPKAGEECCSTSKIWFMWIITFKAYAIMESRRHVSRKSWAASWCSTW